MRSTRSTQTAVSTVCLRRACDLAGCVFLLMIVANTTLLSTVRSWWIAVPLMVVQALLLLGCQEAKHLAAHRSFLSHRGLNDFVGTIWASLIGENFTAFRYFHFKHHLATCNDDDPEGLLYAMSWRTRWIWAMAPLEVFWVAFHLNSVGHRLVPANRRADYRLSTLSWLAVVLALALFAWCAPRAFLWTYVIPMALSAWIDFPLTQAEHYAATVRPSGTRRRSETLSNDLVMPLCLGWPMLHRSLHRLHHCQPNALWIDAPRRLRSDTSATPIDYAEFARRWLREGPRLWEAEIGVAPPSARVQS